METVRRGGDEMVWMVGREVDVSSRSWSKVTRGRSVGLVGDMAAGPDSEWAIG